MQRRTAEDEAAGILADSPNATDSVATRLTNRLAELRERIEQIEAAERQPLDRDAREQVVEREDDEPQEGLERMLRREVEATTSALARIATGDYGLCVSCGGTIASDRLDALPTASLCIDCASAPGS